MRYTLENENVSVEIDSHGAELRSIKKNGKEYMWCGDAAYWGRISPVLFPLVGSLKGKRYRHGNQEYEMGQHGFARDMEFILEEQRPDTIWFVLESNEDTMKKYPYAFHLHVGYQLNENQVKVLWRVENPNTETMYFAIGAHPAFRCPLEEEKEGDRKAGYGLDFGTAGDVEYRRIDEDGLALDELHVLKTQDGTVTFTEDFYDRGVYIVENHQSQSVSLLNPEGQPYVTVKFDAPLWGTWSPEGKNAPFVCIEPWYGRCDGSEFAGELSQRDYENALKPEDTFEAAYTISVF